MFCWICQVLGEVFKVVDRVEVCRLHLVVTWNLWRGALLGRGLDDEWGLTVSIEKTKGLATGDNLSEEDIAPVQVEGERLSLCKLE